MDCFDVVYCFDYGLVIYKVVDGDVQCFCDMGQVVYGWFLLVQFVIVYVGL